MKRFSNILYALVLMMGLSTVANAQTWTFGTISSDDKALLDADVAKWYNDTEKSRYNYLPAISDAALTANGTELSITKGLKFTAGEAKASSDGKTLANQNGKLRLDYGHGCFAINGNGVVVTITGVKKDQIVTVEFTTSSNGTERSFEVTNLTDAKNFSNKDTKSRTKGTGKATADGDVTLTSTGGIYLFSITVADEGVEPTPASEDYSVMSNTLKNQAVLTLKTGVKKFYNTESLESIDFRGANVTMNLGNNKTYTYEGNVAGINFTKADVNSGEMDNPTGAVQITEARGWLESAYIKFQKYDGAKTYNVYVNGTKIDGELVRDYGSYGRADAVGLAAGTYSMKIEAVDANGNVISGSASEATNIEVKSYSREGFAFLNGYEPGAYKSDGTLKEGAKVLYVTKNTAKTISTNVTGAETNPCVGLQAIVAAYEKGQDKTPIAFRFIGLVTKDDLDAIGSKEEGIQVKGRKADSELNLTFEGIGDDATIKGFGFLIRNSKSLEFRNFGIMRCLDDGLSFDTDNSNCWVHHMDIFYGPNGGGDHAKGDGALDVKSDSKYVTVSYNHFWDTGKSNMFGMKNESGPNYISYDHNWFDHSDSRHPRVRTMSVHVWNNYFDNVAKYGAGATTGASVFVESNYFLKTKKPILSSLQGTDGLGSGTFSGEDGGMIKAYGNYFDRNAVHFSYYTQKNPSSKGYDAYEVDNRDDQVPSTEKTLVGNNTYNNFDTNSSLMYGYNPVTAEEVPGLVTGYYGAGRLNHGDFTYTFSDNVGSDDEDSAYDAKLGGMLDNYSSKLVGIFGGETINPGGGGDEGGDEPAPEGTILASFDGSPSSTMFTVAGDYGDGKATYEGSYAKKGVKLNSKGSVTFTPQKNYNMTIVLGTAKKGRNVKLNGTATSVGGKEDSDNKYYEMEAISVSAGTQCVISQGDAEGILMFIKLAPVE